MQSVLHTSVCANVYTRCQSLAFNVWIAKFQNIASGFSRMCLCATDAKCLATIMNNNSFRILETSFCTQIKLSLNFSLSKNTSSHTHTHPNTFYAFSLGAFAVEPINDNFTVKFFVHFKLKICSLSVFRCCKYLNKFTLFSNFMKQYLLSTLQQTPPTTL